MLNEAAIISLLQSKFTSPMGIGDDAAILPLCADEQYVISNDLLVEDIHFRRQYFDPSSLAYKALHVNLSDIAAMGALPKYALLGMAIPKNYSNYLNEFLHAFAQACKDAGVILIGGDTTASRHSFFISVTLLGIVNKQQLKTRSQAKNGDVISVTGPLGAAHIGWQALEQQKLTDNLTPFITHFLRPTAKVAEGLWLSHQPAVHAMMDISDGLFIDLKKLCLASNVAAVVSLETFTYNTEFASACTELAVNPTITQLSGGEDYSLLIIIAAADYQPIATAFKQQFGYSLMIVGHIIAAEPGTVTLFDHHQAIDYDLPNFCHFGELS